MWESDPRRRQCLRCGEHICYPETGRPREYCGDACRQAGARLRRKHGCYWWKQQPWYPGWLADEKTRHEKWERERPERERQAEEARQERARADAEEARLIGSMPPDIRKSYEAAKADARRRRAEKTDLAILRMRLETIALENEDLLGTTGYQIRLIDMSRKMDKLLRSALYAENEHEAAALFAKARQLRAAGEDLDEEPAVMDLLSGWLRDLKRSTVD
jgi:hypothetical protein